LKWLIKGEFPSKESVERALREEDEQHWIEEETKH
jgi:hypothetical protein